MKRLVVVVNPEKKRKLEEVFDDLNVGGVIISTVQGYGNQKGNPGTFRGSKMKTTYLFKIQAETVVPDDLVDELVETLLEELYTGEIGDGKIFIYDALEVIRVRTGERGEKAL